MPIKKPLPKASKPGNDLPPGFQDHYAALSIKQSATTFEIKKAHKKGALKHHPDKHPDAVDKEKHTALFRLVQEASEVLLDQVKRTEYDREWQKHAPKAVNTRTATFTKEGDVEDYQPPPEPIPEEPRNGRIISPTLDKELSYFFAVADGERIPAHHDPDPPTLVLHLYRATDPGRRPVAERMMLGQGKGAPYYALHAVPSTTSVDEFNTLQITRRHPMTGNHKLEVISEIQPKLDLDFEGSITIARITKGQNRFNLVRTGSNATGDKGLLNSIALWTEPPVSYAPQTPTEVPHLMAQYVLSEGWKSLDILDGRLPRGIIRAKKPVRCDASSLLDAYSDDLAYLDFTTEYPQFVSQNHVAHEQMDVLIAGFFTTAIYETRRAAWVNSKPKIAPQFRPGQFAPGDTPGAAASPGDIEALLTCSICREIMHNPVSLITATTVFNKGCLHDFCGACIVQNLQCSNICPQDRQTITGINDNRNLAQIIEKFLEANPGKRQSAEDIADMDAIYQIGKRVHIPTPH